MVPDSIPQTERIEFTNELKMSFYLSCWPIFIIGIVLGLVCYGISQYLRKIQNEKGELTKLQKDWMSATTVMKWGFPILVFLIPLIVQIDITGIILFIGAIFALPSLIKKG